jgi:hypothetical protein
LTTALEQLIEGAIRGDPKTPLRWVSRSQRHLAEALRGEGFKVSQKLVGSLLKKVQYSCQANRKTREGSNHPDRNAQFEHINAMVRAAMDAGEPSISVDTKKKELSLHGFSDIRLLPNRSYPKRGIDAILSRHRKLAESLSRSFDPKDLARVLLHRLASLFKLSITERDHVIFDTDMSRNLKEWRDREFVSEEVAAFDRKMADSDHSIGNDS